MTAVLARPDWISAISATRQPKWLLEAPVTPHPGVGHPHAPGLEIVGATTQVPLVGGGEVEYANLDHGASTPALRVVRDTVDALLQRYASVHRGAGWHSKVCTELYEGARQPVRSFVGGRSDDAVIFTKNTTDSFNLLAHCLPARTTVVVFETEHHAALLPWEGRPGLNVIRLKAPESPAAALSAVDQALRNRPAGPALLVVTGASNVTGEIWPVTALAALARSRGARIALDAAQLAPHRPFSIEELGVDYVALSGHKLYAPYGSGALVGRADWLAQAAPFSIGGGATATVSDDETTWKPLPDRHEAGSPNVLGAVALAAACHVLAQTDRVGLAEREQALTERVRDGLRDIPGVTVHTLFGGQVETIGVVTFTIAGQSSAVVAAALSAEHGIGVRDGAFCAQPLVRRLLGTAGCSAADGTGHAIRASVGLATTTEHVERLVAAIKSIADAGPRRRYLTVNGRPTPAVDDRELPRIAPWQ